MTECDQLLNFFGFSGMLKVRRFVNYKASRSGGNDSEIGAFPLLSILYPDTDSPDDA